MGAGPENGPFGDCDPAGVGGLPSSMSRLGVEETQESGVSVCGMGAATPVSLLPAL